MRKATDVAGGTGNRIGSRQAWGFLSPATRHPGFSSAAKALNNMDPHLLILRNWERAGGVSV